MKIDPNSLPQAPLPGTQPGAADRVAQRTIDNLYGGRPERPAGAAEAAGTDSVELSRMSHYVAALAEDSPERAQRMERLSELVQAGRYEPDAEAVSQAIVDEAMAG